MNVNGFFHYDFRNFVFCHVIFLYRPDGYRDAQGFRKARKIFTGNASFFPLLATLGVHGALDVT